MKFKVTKKWCEDAAKSEQGVGGLMACNPNYLKENKMYSSGAKKSFMKKTKLTKEQKDFIQGKIKKIKGLDTVIKQQELFIEQVKLTNIFLKMYEGNPECFKLLIGDDIWAEYQFEKGFENPEWMWESIDELTCAIVYKEKKFKITGNGLFPVIHFTKTTDKKFAENFEYLKKYGSGGEWHI